MTVLGGSNTKNTLVSVDTNSLVDAPSLGSRGAQAYGSLAEGLGNAQPS